MRKHQTSRTAELIAESISFLASEQKFSRLVPPESAELSRVFSQKRGKSKSKFVLSMQNSLLNSAIPGISLHYILRKKRIEEFVREAINEDFRQIVVLGAGFDTLCLRVGKEFSDVNFIEIDLFENQLKKIRSLNHHQIPFPNLSFIAGDLEKMPLGLILNSSLFDPKIKTFFIAEGLLMYLSEAKVRGIFRSISAICHLESRFAFTSMNKKKDGKIRFDNSSGVVDFWLDLHGEPFKWGISPGTLPYFLDELAFDLKNLETDQNFRQNFLNTADLRNEKIAQGEFLCLAEVR